MDEQFRRDYVYAQENPDSLVVAMERNPRIRNLVARLYQISNENAELVDNFCDRLLGYLTGPTAAAYLGWLVTVLAGPIDVQGSWWNSRPPTGGKRSGKKTRRRRRR